MIHQETRIKFELLRHGEEARPPWPSSHWQLRCYWMATPLSGARHDDKVAKTFIPHRLLFVLLMLLLHSLITGACKSVSEPRPSSSGSDKVAQYWLTTSMFAGRFYDNDQLKLMDHRPFSAISDVETVDGFILHPPRPSAIVPAGTLVQIIDISYPGDMDNLKRPIFSPRDHIWVYLKVAKERGKVSLFHEKTYVLVMPKNITNETELRGYLARF
ncbi:MAG TPA: hypothetical protein VEK06_05360, partial [Myxococcota bacterium]|nr:hypothetical protein [Myxococcota bacterium]